MRRIIAAMVAVSALTAVGLAGAGVSVGITPAMNGSVADPVAIWPNEAAAAGPDVLHAPAAAPSGTVVAAGTNLLVNPDAEVGTCTTSGYDAMTVPGWTVTQGSPDTVCYGSVGFPKAGVPGPRERGRAFFSGGATGDAVMTQTLSIASASARVDQGSVEYFLGGWLGGWAAQNDRATVNVTFVDGRGARLGGDVLDPATNTDRDSVTGLVAHRTSGWLPSRTRAIIVSVAFTWTAGDTTDGYADDLSLSLSTPVAAPSLAVPASNVPAFDHVFLVLMSGENATHTEAPTSGGHYVVGNPAAPYLNHTVGVMGSRLAQMYATTHPSDPNFLALSGGSTFGWTTDPVVGRDTIDAPNIGDELENAGLTWKAYASGAYGGCDMSEHNTEAGGYYLPDALPFMLYRSIASNHARCAAHVQPLTSLATDLQSIETTPSFVWFAPNDVDNMNGGGVAAGDKWLSQTLPAIFDSPAWTQQRSLLIVSWDQGYANAFGPGYPNHVATYVVGSQDMVKPGYTSPIRYTDFSLTRTVEEALGVGSLTSNDRYAVPLGDVWRNQGGGSGGPGANGNGGGSAAALHRGR